MAKFNPAADMDKYASSGGAYFSLKNDKDTAMVRFMFESVDDIVGYSVHKVKVNGNDRYVNCLREYADPLDKCPLCEAHFKLFPRFFVPLYMMDTGETVIWDRGPGKNNSFYSQLTDLCNKYNPLVSYPVEVERNGKAGDFDTTYEMYVQECDDTLLEDLPEIPDPTGSLLLDKSYDELMTYVQTGSFDMGDTNPINTPTSDNSVARRRRDVPASGVSRRRGTGNSDIPL